MRKPNPHADIHALKKDVASLKGKFATLTKKVMGLTEILHERPGLNPAQEKEILGALKAHVNKLKGVGQT